jgi:hypothetical protein
VKKLHGDLGFVHHSEGKVPDIVPIALVNAILMLGPWRSKGFLDFIVFDDVS